MVPQVIVILLVLMIPRTRGKFSINPVKLDNGGFPCSQKFLVKYGQTPVVCGQELTVDASAIEPDVEFDVSEPEKWYSLVMIDPDARWKNLNFRSWLHWVRVNIPGNKVKLGDEVVDYNGPSPPRGVGPHRYIFLVFKQEGKVKTKQWFDGRASFNVDKYITKYKLHPEASFYFKAERK